MEDRGRGATAKKVNAKRSIVNASTLAFPADKVANVKSARMESVSQNTKDTKDTKDINQDPSWVVKSQKMSYD